MRSPMGFCDRSLLRVPRSANPHRAVHLAMVGVSDIRQLGIVLLRVLLGLLVVAVTVGGITLLATGVLALWHPGVRPFVLGVLTAVGLGCAHELGRELWR